MVKKIIDENVLLLKGKKDDDLQLFFIIIIQMILKHGHTRYKISWFFRWLRNFPRIVWKTNHFHLSISHDNNSSTKKLTTISFLFDMFKLDVIEIHYSSSPKTPIMIYQRHYLIRNNFQTSMTCVGSSLLLTFTLSALREDKIHTKNV